MKNVAPLLASSLVAALVMVSQAAAQTDPSTDCDADPTQPPTPIDDALVDDDAFMTPIGSYKAAGFDASGAEIVAFDAATARVFTINSVTERVDIIDASDPFDPSSRAAYCSTARPPASRCWVAASLQSPTRRTPRPIPAWW